MIEDEPESELKRHSKIKKKKQKKKIKKAKYSSPTCLGHARVAWPKETGNGLKVVRRIDGSGQISLSPRYSSQFSHQRALGQKLKAISHQL